MMAASEPLTLIVVAYHRPERLAGLLASAQGQCDRAVVVNVEDDPAVASAALAQGATVVPLPGNPGYAAAVNVGVAEASTPLVAFANDDLDLHPGCLALLASALGAADVAVPRLLRPDGSLEPSIARLVSPAALMGEWMALPDRRPRLLPRRLPVQKWRRPERVETIEAAEAALVVTRRRLLTAEPLPEAYFLYWEEHEWFHRLRSSGQRTVYVPDAVATHSGWGELDAAKSRLLARNAVRCLARTGGRRSALVGWPIVIAWWARLLAVDSIRVLARPSHDSRARWQSRWAGLAAAGASWREVRAA